MLDSTTFCLYGGKERVELLSEGLSLEQSHLSVHSLMRSFLSQLHNRKCTSADPTEAAPSAATKESCGAAQAWGLSSG